MQTIQSPFDNMVEAYNKKVQVMKQVAKANYSTDDARKLAIEKVHSELIAMKQLLEASNIVQFFADGGCEVISEELYKMVSSEINQDGDDTYKGESIIFLTCGSSGSHENHLGNGDISLHLHRPHAKCPWVDLGHISFTNSTKEQIEQMETAPSHSIDYREHGNHRRRLSRKQAHYLQQEIAGFIMNKFQGRIPSDDEI